MSQKVRIQMRKVGFVFDWVDDIHFVGYQLDHLYGVDRWPWRLLGDIVGVSTSTARKYYNEDWYIEDDEQREFVEKTLKDLDFKTLEIKFLTLQKQRCFVNTSFHCYFEDFPKDGDYEQRSVQQVLPLMSNGKADWPTNPGIYLLCQIGCICNQPDRKQYLIKIGKSTTNLRNRIQSYHGMNPLSHCLDVCATNNGIEASDLEAKMHEKLGKKYARCGNTEWFLVPEKDYINILAKGIKYLY